MIPYLIVVFLIVCAFVYLEDYLDKDKLYAYISICVVLVLIAALREVGKDDDSLNYQKIFENYDDEFITATVESSYIFLSRIFYNMGHDIHSIFFVYAMISIPLKFMAIRRLSEQLFLPIVFYLSHFFILHDMIEIRVSAAIGFFLMGLYPLAQGERKKAFLWFCGAMVFHYSTLALFPLLFLSNKPLSNIWKYGLASIVPLGYAMYFAHIDVLTAVPLPFIGDKLELYREMKDLGAFDEIIVIKNPILLIKIVCFYIILIYNETISIYNKNIPLLTKIMGVSLFCFFFFSALPVLSGRMYELFGAIDVVTICSIVYVIRPVSVSRGIVIGLACIQMFMDVAVYKLIR